MSRYLQGIRYKDIAAYRAHILRSILNQHRITADELPSATRAAVTYPAPEVRRAAQLAFATGCLITSLRVVAEGYGFELRPPGSAQPLSVQASGPACEAEMHGKLRQCGLRPPAHQLVKAFFAQITL